MEPVIFKMPPFGEIYNAEILETGKEFYAEELLPLPFDEVELHFKYPIYEVDMEAKIKLIVRQSKQDGELRHDARAEFETREKDVWMELPTRFEYKVDSKFLEHKVLDSNEFSSLFANTLQGVDEGEVWLGEMLVMCLMAVNLPQYEHKEVKIAEKLNKRRAKRGKPPLKDYIQIQMRPEYRKALSAGEGIAKTPHWRRGHVRTLADGRKVPVKPCMVNFRGEDIEPKEYRVTV